MCHPGIDQRRSKAGLAGDDDAVALAFFTRPADVTAAFAGAAAHLQLGGLRGLSQLQRLRCGKGACIRLAVAQSANTAYAPLIGARGQLGQSTGWQGAVLEVAGINHRLGKAAISRADLNAVGRGFCDFGALQPVLTQADGGIGLGGFIQRRYRMGLDAQRLKAALAGNAVGINGTNGGNVVSIVHAGQACGGAGKHAAAHDLVQLFVVGQHDLVAHGSFHGRQRQADPTGIFGHCGPG